MIELVKVQGLKKSFPSGFWGQARPVLSEISFSLPEGSVTGLIGGNGSGKTTTIKCLLGFLFPDEGHFQFGGGAGGAKDFRARLGYLPERPYYPDYLTAREFLEFHARLLNAKGDPSPEIKSALDRVGLIGVSDRKLRGFSKGMLQRIGLAQALLMKPRILILDEPMSGLDPDGRLLVKEILMEEHRQGTTILFSTHLLVDVQEICDRVLVFDSGKLLFEGSLESLLSSQAERGLEQAFSKLRLSSLQEERQKR